MSTMNNGTSWNDAVTINKQSGTKITLDTDSKFVAKDIELTINVQAGSATTPNTTITANPTLSINSSTGVVTGTVSATKSVTPTVNAGYVSTGSAGTMTVSGSKTLSLTTQAAQTITPGTTNKTIASGRYLTGTQTIKGDSNLVAANIAEGVSIFGVTGTHSSGIDTSDATATANDILSNKTAYVNGSKITGNIPSKSSSNLTVSGATVTAPAGYYSTAATKTIDSGSTTQNAPTINSSTGLVTATATVTAGYQAADTKSNTLQLTTQAAQTITPGTTNKTISSGRYLTGKQTIKGDANLVAANIAQGVSIFGVTGTHSGGTDVEDSIITRKISGTYENSRVTSIGDYAFYNCSKLTSVSFPLCLSIGNNAFYYCFSLASVSFPSCSFIGNNAFYNCSNLTLVSFPSCQEIGNDAFYSCKNLSSVSFPSCSFIANCAFSSCSNLTSVSFPSCLNIGNSAFYSCINLASASFPVCKSIYSNVFNKCYNLISLYLTGSSYVSLGYSNAFSSTPIGGYSTSAGRYGSIYVPASMLASYKTRTNWTFFSSRFVGV